MSDYLGTPIAVGDWRITVEGIREAPYIRSDSDYYSANNDSKIVVVTIKIENAGEEASNPTDIRDFLLITNANKSYEMVYTLYQLEWLISPSEEVVSKAIVVNELETSTTLAPGTYTEGDIIFVIPQYEAPEKLYFKVGIIGAYEVEIKLR